MSLQPTAVLIGCLTAVTAFISVLRLTVFTCSIRDDGSLGLDLRALDPGKPIPTGVTRLELVSPVLRGKAGLAGAQQGRPWCTVHIP